MKIILSGVETNNKGAELMLYAILQEIERKWPYAKVYIPYSHLKQEIGYIHTAQDFRLVPGSKWNYKIKKLLRRLHLPFNFLPEEHYIKGADFFLDGSGFAYSDQWKLSDSTVKKWNLTLAKLHQQGTKIVYLPQAFGPVELTNTRKMLKIISENASLIMPREIVSYNYLKQADVDLEKVKIFADFTSLVEGIFPSRYKNLREGVCIIPNMRMIDKGVITYDGYLTLLKKIIFESKNYGRPVYLLNHEGKKDEQFAYRCGESIGKEIEVVTGLNALEVKGLISSAYIVVTSRFHGLASALNSCVPSLATSWSHKYQELFKEYNQSDSVLPLDDLDQAVQMVCDILAPSKNEQIRSHLLAQQFRIMKGTKEMWNSVWSL